MKLVFLMISFLIFCVSIGALISIVVFCIDVFRWHSQEKRLKIVPSAQELPDEFKEISKESEVKNDAGVSPVSDRTDAGQSDSSAVFASWLQS